MARATLLAIVGAVAVLAAQGCGRNPQTAAAGGVAGMASVSGTVQAPAPFQAARVHAVNLTSGVRYIVFTSGGRYRISQLFPGSYEVSVEKNGFESDARRVTVSADQGATLDFTLRAVPSRAIAQAGTMGPARTWDRAGVQLLPFDQLYPPDPARDLLATHCLYCHGLNSLPTRPRSAAAWDAAIDVMSDPNSQRGVRIPPGSLPPADRQRIVEIGRAHV